MFNSNSVTTRVFAALVVMAVIGVGGVAATGEFTVADGTETAPSASTNETVSTSETATFTVTVEDSANGNDTATGTLDITDSTSTGVVENTVALNGSTVTISGGDVNAIGVSGIPDGYYPVSDTGGGTLQQSDNGVIWQSGGNVSFTLTPPESAEAGDTVTFDVKIGQQDPQSVTLEVVEQSVPGDLPDSISPAKYSAVAGDDSDINTFDLVDAIQGASDDGTYNGQEFSTFDFVDLIQYNSG